MLKKLKFITRDYVGREKERQLEKGLPLAGVSLFLLPHSISMRNEGMQMECHLLRSAIFPGSGHCPIDSWPHNILCVMGNGPAGLP